MIVWKASNDPQTTLRGRCRWDIDVVWSGVGLVCDRSPSYVSWVCGAVSRLCVTVIVLVRLSGHKLAHTALLFTSTAFPFQVTYHVVLYKYRMACRAAEIADRGPYTWFPKSAYADRRKSVTTAGSGRTRTSRPQSVLDRAESISPPPSVHIHSEQAYRTQLSTSDVTVQTAPGTLRDETMMPESIASSSPDHSGPPGTSAGPSSPLYEDTDLHSFVNQFRHMVNQAARDTELGLGYAFPASPEEYDRVDLGDHEFNPYAEVNLLYDANGSPIEVSVDPSQIQVFGRMVHRMPTITSIGSGERSSRAPSRACGGQPPTGERSLPSSRSNTVENDIAGQPTPRQGAH